MLQTTFSGDILMRCKLQTSPKKAGFSANILPGDKNYWQENCHIIECV